MEVKEKIKKAKEQIGESFRKVKGKIGEKVDKSLCFLAEHPEVTIPLLSSVGMLIGGGVRIISNAGNRNLDHCRVQDDITDEEFLTEHPLTNDEILELGRRMNLGEPKGVALQEMGLLRNERKRK